MTRAEREIQHLRNTGVNLLDRAEKAEALAVDHENQIAELLAGMDQAEGRVAELEGALYPAEQLLTILAKRNVNALISSGDIDTMLVTVNAVRQALSGDGSRIMDVVKAARECRQSAMESADELIGLTIIGPHAGRWKGVMDLLEEHLLVLFQALDALDGKEPSYDP